MESPINLYFFLFLIILYYIYDIYKDKFNKHLGKQENFSNIYSDYKIDKYENLDNKLYIYNVNSNNNIPKLYSNFRYSIENKIAYEISKELMIHVTNTSGLYHNLENNLNNPNSILMVSETDYIDKYETYNSNYGFVCSLYKVYFIMLCKILYSFESYSDLINYVKKNPDKKIRIGIPNKNSNSYNDAQKIFNLLGLDEQIDFTKKTNYKYFEFVIDTEKNLFLKFKKKINDDDHIDLLYLTTGYKNFYLEEYLFNNNCFIFGTDGINESLIKQTFKSIIFKSKFINNKITLRFVKKKLLFDYVSDKNIITVKESNTFSNRIILIANNKVSKSYIKYLLKNLYAGRDNIERNVNKYVYNEERNNTIDNFMDYYEMFYIDKRIKYHDGAYDFYKDVELIVEEN